MKTMAQEFEVWARAVLPPGVGATQFTEVRRAFYSGAFVAMQTIMELTGPDEEDDAVGADRLQKLYDELCAFFEDVKEGRA